MIQVVASLWQIFTVFAKIGAFTIGGGYAMLPLVQAEVCDRKKWMSDDEFLDILSIVVSYYFLLEKLLP